MHVGKGSSEAKFWLEPIRLARAGRFKAIELREVESIIHDNRNFILNAWTREQQKRANR